MPKGKTGVRKDIDQLGGPKRLEVDEAADEVDDLNEYRKEKIMRGLFHNLLVSRDVDKNTEELNPFGRKFLSTFGRVTANKLPVLNISEPDLEQLFTYMNSEAAPEDVFNMPGLGIDVRNEKISKDSPLVLWDPTYTTVLPVDEQITSTGKERAKSFLDSSNKADSLAPIWETFKRMIENNDEIWNSIKNDDTGAPRGSKTIANAIQYARPKTQSIIEDLITAQETPAKRKAQRVALKERGAQGRGKTFSPSIIRIGRGSYEY